MTAQARRFQLIIHIEADRLRDLDEILEDKVLPALAGWRESKRIELDADYDGGKPKPAPNLHQVESTAMTDSRVSMTDNPSIQMMREAAEDRARADEQGRASRGEAVRRG